MPIDTVGEVVVEVVGAVVEAAVEPPKRGRVRRFLYWSVVVLVLGLLGWLVYLAVR